MTSLKVATMFKLLLMTVVILRSAFKGILVIACCACISAGACYVLVPPLIDIIPAFQKKGDGGRGIGVDLVADAAPKALVPITAGALFSVLAFIVAVNQNRHRVE